MLWPKEIQKQTQTQTQTSERQQNNPTTATTKKKAHNSTRSFTHSPFEIPVVGPLHQQPPANARVPVDHRRCSDGNVRRCRRQGYGLVPKGLSGHRNQLGVAFQPLRRRCGRSEQKIRVGGGEPAVQDMLKFWGGEGGEGETCSSHMRGTHYTLTYA